MNTYPEIDNANFKHQLALKMRVRCGISTVHL